MRKPATLEAGGLSFGVVLPGCDSNEITEPPRFIQDNMLPFRAGNALEAFVSAADPVYASHICRSAWRECLDVWRKHGDCHDRETRECAAAHESGHAVMHAWFGRIPDSVRVYPVRHKRSGSWIWGGWTEVNDGGWTSTPWSPVEQDVDRIAQFMAGLCGEMFVGLDHPASSIDERIAANLMAGQACLKLPRPIADLEAAAGALMVRLAAEIHSVFTRHAAEMAELRTYLMTRRIARRPVLERILGPVKSAADAAREASR